MARTIKADSCLEPGGAVIRVRRQRSVFESRQTADIGHQVGMAVEKTAILLLTGCIIFQKFAGFLAVDSNDS
jgi:hypothetical protein